MAPMTSPVPTPADLRITARDRRINRLGGAHRHWHAT
jgi:hypothetical protein